jgi:hypothetical protein
MTRHNLMFVIKIQLAQTSVLTFENVHDARLGLKSWSTNNIIGYKLDSYKLVRKYMTQWHLYVLLRNRNINKLNVQKQTIHGHTVVKSYCLKI